jgi:hypothetical protein
MRLLKYPDVSKQVTKLDEDRESRSFNTTAENASQILLVDYVSLLFIGSVVSKHNFYALPKIGRS